MSRFFGHLQEAMLDRPWLVVGAWAAVLIFAGGLLAPRAGSVVKSIAFKAPASDSDKAAELLQREFSSSSLSTVAVVLRSDSLTTDQAAFQIQVALANERMRTEDGVRQVRDYTSGDPTLVSPDHHTTIMLVGLPADDSQQQALIPKLRERLQGVTLEHHIAGRPATNYDLKATSEVDLRHAELITFPLILVLLLIAFRSVIAAVIPLVLGGASVAVALALVYLIGSRTEVSVFAINVSTMFGLGLGIDFALIVVTRFRAELAAGGRPREAVIATMASAGRSVTYSGLIVVLGMMVMTLLLDLMVVRSISLGVFLVALAAVASALTLLPALLLLLGPRIEWLSLPLLRRQNRSPETGFWYRTSQAITRRPWPWLAVAVLVILVLAVPAGDLRLTGSDPELLPPTSDSVLGAHAIDAAFGPNQTTPIQIVIRSRVDGVWDPIFLDDTARLTAMLGQDPRVESVNSLTTLAAQFGLSPTSLNPRVVGQNPLLQAAAARLVNARGDTTIINVVPRVGPFSAQQENLVKELRERTLPGFAPVFSEAHVGGSGALFIDFRDRLYSEFPGLAAAVLALTFLILMLFFRSIVLPLKAVLLNVASILATYGALVAIFEYGWGSTLVGFHPLGKITVVTPAVLFVILFGLSTDYEVFVLSRVREMYRITGDNARAVAIGLQQSAGIITTAALILMGVFLSFATGGILTLKELGIGLGIGILIDTTIVRIILVPATMRLLGSANWWMPGWLQRILPEISEGGPAVPALVPIALAPSADLAPTVAPTGIGTGSTVDGARHEPTQRRDDASMWHDHTGARAVVHVPEGYDGSNAARSAPSVLREAEQTIAALERLLEPPVSGRATAVHIYLTDPVMRLWERDAFAPRDDGTGTAAPSLGPASPAPPAWLIDAAGQRRHIEGDVTLLGSSRPNDIFVDDPTVARCHAIIFRAGTRYLLKAMGGPNPTLVNDLPVTKPHALRRGDVIQLGHVGFRFECEVRHAPVETSVDDAIVRNVDPEDPSEPLAYPLARLLVPRWFGAKLAAAPILLDGIAGVVCARTGIGPSIQEAHDWARSEILAGRPVSIFAHSPDSGEGDRAAVSFTAFLLEKYGSGALRRLVRTYDPERRDQATLTVYERPLAALEELWLAGLRRAGGAGVLRSFVRHVAPLLKPYWAREVEVLGYLLLEMLYGVAIPLSAKWLIDNVIPSRSVRVLLLFIIALLGLYTVNALIATRRVYVSEVINQRLLMSLQERMFEHLQRLPHDFYSEAKVGDILSRLTRDVTAIEEALQKVTGVGVLLVLRALATAVAMLVLSPFLGALVLAVVPIFAVSHFALRSRLQAASHEAQTMAGEVASVAQETLSAHDVVKAFSLEQRTASIYHARLISAFRVGLRMTMIGTLFETSVALATTLGQLVVLGVGGYLIITGNLTVGTLLAFIGLLAALFYPIAVHSSTGQTLQTASGALDRVRELLEAPISIADRDGAVALPPLAQEIRFEGVSFGYAPQRPVLNNLTLTVPVGQHIALVGPSGSGKSTLVNLMLRFWDVSEGAILLDGHDVREVTLESLRGQIGLVFQETFIFDTTIRENIAIGRIGATDEEVAAAARAARLDSYIDSLPTGYDTVLGERGVRMSGGQRQRLAIARALLRQPRILILDEATSSLDAQTESEVLGTLASLATGRTTISVTHRLALAALADRVYVLDQGRLVEQGRHAELVRAGGLYQQLYEEQMRHIIGNDRVSSVDAERLRAVPLFAGLSSEAMAALMEMMRVERYPPDHDVVRQGDTGDRFFVIVSGRVDVLVSDKSGEHRVNMLTGGEYFGEIALLAGVARTATVRTTMPTELYSLTRSDFLMLMEQEPGVHGAVEDMLASRRAALGRAAAMGAPLDEEGRSAPPPPEPD